MFGLYMFGSELGSVLGNARIHEIFLHLRNWRRLLTVFASPDIRSFRSSVHRVPFSDCWLAYGVLFPNRIIYLYMIIPIQAKWFVVIFGAITFLSSLSATGGGVAYVAHLGGMLFGFVYLKGGRLYSRFSRRYERWQRNRLRRKFEVYLQRTASQ